MTVDWNHPSSSSSTSVPPRSTGVPTDSSSIPDWPVRPANTKSVCTGCQPGRRHRSIPNGNGPPCSGRRRSPSCIKNTCLTPSTKGCGSTLARKIWSTSRWPLSPSMPGIGWRSDSGRPLSGSADGHRAVSGRAELGPVYAEGGARPGREGPRSEPRGNLACP